MEFFLPGLLFFIVTIVFTMMVAPKVTPMVAAVLSVGFLTYGVYDHYRFFASEYRFSTWQQGLKIYSPFIMIAAIIIYIMYAMTAFFTNGSVPIPNVSLPNAIPALSNTANSVANSFTEVTNNISNTITNSINNTKNAISNINRGLNNSLGYTNRNKKSTSLFEAY